MEATDIVIVKRQWGAFYGTELDYGVMGRVRTMAELIDALQAGTGEA